MRLVFLCRLHLGVLLLVAGAPGAVLADLASGDAPAAKAQYPKAVFLDEPQFGRDPFFPNSQRRAQALIPKNPATPQPGALLGKLSLKGISHSKPPLALINNATLAAGERADIRIDSQTLKVHCIEIRETSVLVGIDGFNQTRELRLRGGL